MRDKKILLCAVNAKYIHSNLAVRYLKKYCESGTKHIAVAEYSINDSISNILKGLYKSDADIYGFSCYIWNIGIILNLCSSLKKARPEATIILGGPEVSYGPAGILQANPSVDYIVAGEGEAALLELLERIQPEGQDMSSISGIVYREGGIVVSTPSRPLIPELDALLFPYDSLEGFDNKIVYYETSRGCPFNCQYCLSSTTQGVRYLSMDRLKQDIKHFIGAGLRQVKLVDRTFNSNIRRAVEIMEYIISLGSGTNFHFEIAADLIDEAFLETAKKAPDGMFQFEIGVQSTNPKTLQEIKRIMDFNKVCHNVTRLVSFGNSHIHLDLIAGLPYEDIRSFERSFNDVYALGPDMLQLGFLKLLKGSGIRECCSRYGLEHHDFPPYEVIKTRWLSFRELLELKDLEQVLEQYYNSGRFRHTLDFLLKAVSVEPFEFFHSLSSYWNHKGHFDSSKGINQLYVIMKQFACDIFIDKLEPWQYSLLNEYLKLDWLLFTRSGSMPSAIDRLDHTLLKEPIQNYLINRLTGMEGFEAFSSMSKREILKYVGYEVFALNIFGNNPESCEMVMFLPLKSETGSKIPFFTVIPLSEILQEA